MTKTLQAVHCVGIHTDSLGHYLSGLGLLSAAAQQWPGVRGCWRDGHFVLVAENISFEAVEEFLLERWKRTPYQRWWATAQKKDTNAKSSANLWRMRGECKLHEIPVLDAHIVGVDQNRFNPLFGTGGNVARRDLAKLCDDAAKLLEKGTRREWLRATLTGEATVDLPDLKSAGTWFVFANKTFNSGQAWFREGRVSPWSVLLATEGAFLLSGSVNRRLAGRVRRYAVFPFISEPCQPINDGEVGKSKAEFWAPLWEHPATLVEVRTLFQRGLAQLGGHPACAPHEFAIAARAAGVDAGVTEFIRYELRETTSAKVYEAIPRGRINVGTPQRAAEEPTDSDLLNQLIQSGWLDRLAFAAREPRDPKQRGKFKGLRGPIERSIIAIAERPDDPERWQELLLLLAWAQARIDRNKKLRERCIPVPRLRSEWFHRAWPEPVPPEIQIARATASIGAKGDQPLLVNVFGVEIGHRGRVDFKIPRPQRAVWSTDDPLRAFADVLHRRLVDANPIDPIPLDATQFCHGEFLTSLLCDKTSVDLDQVLRWVPPLALIEWAGRQRSPPMQRGGRSPADGTSLLHALLRPLFSPGTIFVDGKGLFKPERRPHAGLARRLLNLVRYQAIDEAVQVARNAYLAAGRAIVMPPESIRADGERIAAALLVPMYTSEVGRGLRRWLLPGKAPKEARRNT